MVPCPTIAYWFLVGNKGIESQYNMFPYSVLALQYGCPQLVWLPIFLWGEDAPASEDQTLTPGQSSFGIAFQLGLQQSNPSVPSATHSSAVGDGGGKRCPRAFSCRSASWLGSQLSASPKGSRKRTFQVAEAQLSCCTRQNLSCAVQPCRIFSINSTMSSRLRQVARTYDSIYRVPRKHVTGIGATEPSVPCQSPYHTLPHSA